MRRSARLLAALGATVLVAAVSGAPAGAARRSEAYAVSGPSTITLTGHGFGHGHGMSQYGAEGAARQGMTWQQIIGFYYPGTSWGELRGRISVLLTGDTTDDVVVLAQPGLSVTRLTPRKAWTLPANGARQWRINPLTGGRSQVQFARTGGWRTWKVFRGDAELAATNKRLTLVTPSGSRIYRGRLRSASPVPGGTARDTVNVLSMEAYLRGVVPLEIPASWSPDAVRAQAVAARTYAAAERSHPNARHYQICDTTSCQVYGGMGAEHPAATQAVRDTARQGLTYEGRPAFTQFSASSGGWTSAGSAPYLVAQEDPYDGWDGNGVHDWTRTVGDAVLERHFPAIGDLTSIEIGARDGYGDWGGRVQAMTLVGTRGRATTTGDTLRTLLGLRSSWFTVSVAPLTARPKA